MPTPDPTITPDLIMVINNGTTAVIQTLFFVAGIISGLIGWAVFFKNV